LLLLTRFTERFRDAAPESLLGLFPDADIEFESSLGGLEGFDDEYLRCRRVTGSGRAVLRFEHCLGKVHAETGEKFLQAALLAVEGIILPLSQQSDAMAVVWY
jgi:hypothetical protein